MYFTSGPLLEYEKMMQEIPRYTCRPEHQPVQCLPLPGLDYISEAKKPSERSDEK